MILIISLLLGLPIALIGVGFSYHHAWMAGSGVAILVLYVIIVCVAYSETYGRLQHAERNVERMSHLIIEGQRLSAHEKFKAMIKGSTSPGDSYIAEIPHEHILFAWKHCKNDLDFRNTILNLKGLFEDGLMPR